MIYRSFNLALFYFQNRVKIYLKFKFYLAAYWATNPNNTYEHNAVAGCTHFGWWYRILDRSDGRMFFVKTIIINLKKII